MVTLQQWMDGQSPKESDLSLSKKLNISRAHVSRLRRGIYGASRATAEKLEAVTGIPWHTFIEPWSARSGAERRDSAA